MTLTSKLEQNDGLWRLKAKINDGTGSCEVEIHDKVVFTKQYLTKK